jgi:hypothetical protein
MKTSIYNKKILLSVLYLTTTTGAMAGSLDPWNDDQIPGQPLKTIESVISDSGPLNADQTYGQPLETIESVISALNGGAIVNAAIDLSKCNRQDGEATLNLKGGLIVSPYQIKEDGTLLFVGSVYTVTKMFSGEPDPMVQFLRYSVNPKGAITVNSYIYTIPDYTLNSQIDFDCSINNGVSFNAAY